MATCSATDVADSRGGLFLAGVVLLDVMAEDVLLEWCVGVMMLMWSCSLGHAAGKFVVAIVLFLMLAGAILLGIRLG